MNVMSLLQVSFILLKILGKINWSWWEVFIPLYVSSVAAAVYVYLLISRRERRLK